MKIAFFTLGCKVNQNDTESLMELFRRKGHTIVPFDTAADIYVVNTCSVTGSGERKSRQMIRRAVDSGTESIVVVTGCYAQTGFQTVAGIPGVNLVIGMADRPKIVELVEEFLKDRRNRILVSEIFKNTEWTDLPNSHNRERTRATLKIEEGCDEFCTYCIVPYARGRIRSMPKEKVITEFQRLIENGYHEIVLTGIHLGAYGKDLGLDLTKLLAALAAIPGNYRIRLGSLEPNDFGEELMDLVIANPKFCQHLHIPLQSGSDHILKLMKRRYDLEYFANLAARIRDRNPLIAIGTDLIVGFPGESEDDFNSTSQFVKELKFSRMHVFRYSPRQGTPAAKFPGRVPKKIQEERGHLIQDLANIMSREYAAQFLGKKVEVLFEEKTDNGWSGLSGEYLTVTTETSAHLKNSLQQISVTKLNGECLEGICQPDS